MQSVHQVAVATPTLLPAVTTNVYIVENQGEAFIVDAGGDSREAAQGIIQKVEELKLKKVKGIILTHYHRDHAPGAKYLAALYQCPIFCHPEEVENIYRQTEGFPVLSTVEDRDLIQVGDIQLTVLHTPGHTKGHINLWWEEEKLLFSGDNIVGQGTTWIGPPDGNLLQYLQSIERVKSLHPRAIAPGHGPWIHDPMERIQFVIDRRMHREKQILGILQDRPCTAKQLVEIIYGTTIHPTSHGAAEKTMLGHLEKLMGEGKVTQKEASFHLTAFPDR